MHPIAVIRDDKFALHLEHTPHLESNKRITAINESLGHASLAGRWQAVSPRLASEDELALIHTRSHIERVARSAGRDMTSFDLDTQATRWSYEVACLGGGRCVQSAGTGSLEIVSGGGLPWSGRRATMPSRTSPWDFACSTMSPWGPRTCRPITVLKKIMIVDMDAHHGQRHPRRPFTETTRCCMFPCISSRRSRVPVISVKSGRVAVPDTPSTFPWQKGHGGSGFRTDYPLSAESAGQGLRAGNHPGFMRFRSLPA